MSGRLSPTEAARRLGVDQRQVLEWLESGALAGVREGTAWQVEPAALLEFARRREARPGAGIGDDVDDTGIESDAGISLDVDDSEFSISPLSDIAGARDDALVELSDEPHPFDDAFEDGFDVESFDVDLLDDDPDRLDEDDEETESTIHEDTPMPATRRSRLGLVALFVSILFAGFVGAGARAFWTGVYLPDREAWRSEVESLRRKLADSGNLAAGNERLLEQQRLTTHRLIKTVANHVERLDEHAQILTSHATTLTGLDERTASALATLRTTVEREATDRRAAVVDLAGRLKDEVAVLRSAFDKAELEHRTQLDDVRTSLRDATETVRHFEEQSHELITASTRELDALHQRRMHEYENRLSAVLFRPPVADDEVDPHRGTVDVADFDREVEAALDGRVNVEFPDGALADVVGFVGDEHRLRVRIDERALRDEGIDPQVEVDALITGIPLRTALDEILRPHELDYVVRNGLLEITTRSVAEDHLVTRVHDVADLLGPSSRSFEDDRDLLYDPAALTALVESAVDPGRFSSNSFDGGGGGAIVYRDGTLVVTESRRPHEVIARLLDDLRRTRRDRRDAANEGREPPAQIAVTYPIGDPGSPTVANPAGSTIPLSDPTRGGVLLGGFATNRLQGLGGPAPANDTPANDASAEAPHTADPLHAQRAERLAALLPKLIDDVNWDPEAGGGYAAAVSGAVLVRHDPAVQARVRRLLLPFAPASGQRLIGVDSGRGPDGGLGSSSFFGPGTGSFQVEDPVARGTTEP